MTRGSGPTQSPAVLMGVQALRGLAASMVVFHHFLGTALEKGFAAAHWTDVRIGNAGVDIFFVISGFIIELTAGGVRETPRSPGDFLVRRAIRILPLMWCFTLLAGAMFWWRGAGDSLHMDGMKFLSSMLLLPDLRASGVGDYPSAYVVPVMWSLSFEAGFYLWFAVLLNRPPAQRLAALAGVFLVSAALGAWWRPESVAMQMLTDPMLFEFLGGCALALAWRNGWRLPTPWACLLAALGMAWLVLDPPSTLDSRLLSWGVPALALVGAVVLARHEGVPWPLRGACVVGEWSYSLYLSHVATLSVFQRAVPALPAGLRESPWALALCFAALSLAVAWAVHVGVERASRRVLTRLWSGRGRLPVLATPS